MSKINIGYMVPEFPGQTHTFFWREINELEKVGISVNIVSTRKPVAGKSPHQWTSNAEQRTTYLSPLGSPASLLLFGIKKIGRILRCLALIASAKDVHMKERLVLTGILAYALKLSQLAIENDWQHLHSHFCYRAADIVLFASIISGISYSISKHGPDLSVGNQNNKWRFASFGTVITKKMLAELKEVRREHLTPNIFVISMGVDTDVFRRETKYQPWRPGDTLVLLCCGRIDRGKGQLDLVEVARCLRDKGIPFEFRIAGNASKSAGGYLDVIKDKIKEFELTGNFRILGAVSEQEVKRHLEDAHIFVLPSRDEPLGVAYMEAMSMEVPTIANNSGGVPELIDDKINGLLCQPADIDSLLTAIEWLLKNPGEAANLGRRAREKILQQYSSRDNAQRLANAFKQTIGQSAPTYR